MTSQKKKNYLKKAAVGAVVAASVLLVDNGYNHIQLQHAQLIQQQEEAERLREDVAALNNHIDELNSKLSSLEQEKKDSENEVTKLKRQIKEMSSHNSDNDVSLSDRAMNVEVTAYDLSIESCGKYPGHPAYGITATGVNLAGHTLESARAIAVDPQIIPLGSRVKIKFRDRDMQCYNGVYTAVDTGGAIKGNRIDLFAGEDARSVAMHIGRRSAKLEVI